MKCAKILSWLLRDHDVHSLYWSQMNNLARWEVYNPVSIGFEDMFSRLDALASNPNGNYPPYNIKKLDDTKQVLEVALAGFHKEDIEVSVEKKVLNINVSKTPDDVGEYVHRGIAQRSFSRNWQLSEDTIVDEVSYMDGLLRVTLRREVPEQDKRKVLPIT